MFNTAVFNTVWNFLARAGQQQQKIPNVLPILRLASSDSWKILAASVKRQLQRRNHVIARNMKTKENNMAR